MFFKTIILLFALGIVLQEALAAPQLDVKVNPSIQNGKNWQVQAGAGVSKNWESANGRHTAGGGVNVDRTYGRSDGRSWKGPVNVGGNVKYGYQNGPHSVGAGAHIQKSNPGGRPDIGGSINYKYNFG